MPRSVPAPWRGGSGRRALRLLGTDAEAHREGRALALQISRQPVLEDAEERIVRFCLACTARRIDGHDFREAGAWVIEALPVDVAMLRHPAQRALLGPGPAVHPVYDPFEHAHVLAEA